MTNTLPQGTVLQGQYRILKVLGIGGMGAVYLAEDMQLFGKQWAVKELLDTFTNAQDRAMAWQQFEREARFLVALDHPNLPKIVRYFPDRGRLYLVMEFVDGQTLEDIMAGAHGFLPESLVVDWAGQVCEVLEYLHSRNPPIIFRDLKPGNIMLGRDNRIRLIDFGIARIFDAQKQTDTLRMGTHGYAPPEQYAGMGRTDPRSDLYALGATMYHLLTGQLPAEAIARILPQPTPLIPPRQINGALSPAIEQAILTAMAEQPANRFQSAAQMKAAVCGWASPATVTATLPCPRCGAPNRVGARFCSSCANPLAPGPAQPVAPQPQVMYAPVVATQPGSVPRPPVAQPAVRQTPGVAQQRGRPSGPAPAPRAAAHAPRKRSRAGLWLGLAIVLLAAAAVLAWRFVLPATRPAPAPTVAAGPAATLTTAPGGATVPVASPAPGSTDTPVVMTPSGGGAPAPSAPPSASPAPPTAMPATATPVPAPAAPRDGSLRVIGEPWEQDGVALSVAAVAVRAESEWQDAAAQVWYRFFNKTGQKLLVDIDWNSLSLEDGQGNRYVDWEGGTTSVWVEAGDSYNFDRYYTRRAGERSRVPAGAGWVQVVVDRFSRVSGARWRLDINPALAAQAAPDPATVRRAGEGWQQGDLSLAVQNVEVRAESDWQQDAVHVSYALSNRGSDRLLVEVDLSHLYVVDSFGQRFNDWEGGGVVGQWLDPGKDWEFDRSYSAMAGQKSRLTRGAQFVLVVAQNVSIIDQAQWQVDLKPVLSALPPWPAGSVQPIGEPWEQDGVALNVAAVAVRAESEWQDAAAQVWYRFFNKTGQKLLVDIDWNSLSLEDSQGNRYVDWEGGTTSVWVEAGDSYNFDRYYTRRAGERSRVPAGAGWVQVVVDRFSRVSGARWQLDINPALAAQAAPDSATVRRAGEGWQQGDLELAVQNVEVRAESDWQQDAVHVSYALSNRGSDRLLVEVDLSHLYVVDSFGQRFNDWEGGGVMVRWLDPGKDWEFDRSYSAMAGQKSRVTQSTQFVLVRAAKLGSIEGAQWQLDIIR